MTPIPVSEILPLQNLTAYKLHLACDDGRGNNPLLDYLASPAAWRGWQEHRGSKNEWNRPLIFSLIDFPTKAGTWLFGGIFRIIERQPDRYEVQKLDDFSQFEGRLLINFRRPARGRSFVLENWWEQMTVEQLLPSRYTGDAFPGLQYINHDFKNLRPIFRREKADWKAALLNTKGIYLLTDTSTGTGKHYVGAAYGDAGIWSRWASYIRSGHGGNKELRELLGEDAGAHNFDHALENFKLAILEPMTSASDDESVRERESHWKRVLMSREYGMNSN
jgi:hypothetical protein